MIKNKKVSKKKGKGNTSINKRTIKGTTRVKKLN